MTEIEQIGYMCKDSLAVIIFLFILSSFDNLNSRVDMKALEFN